MKYSFTCDADGAVMSTEAKSDEEALNQLLKLSKKHVKEHHTAMKLGPDEESKKWIKSIWKKG